LVKVVQVQLNVIHCRQCGFGRPWFANQKIRYSDLARLAQHKQVVNNFTFLEPMSMQAAHPLKQLSTKRKFSQVNPAHNQQQGKKKKQKINHEDNGLVIQHGRIIIL